MKISVKLSDMIVSSNPEDTLVVRDLGSGLAVEAYDPVRRVGGVLHCMLPSAKDFAEVAKRKPCMFADTGLPAFLEALFRNGACREGLQINLAGGACFLGNGSTLFNVGKESLKQAMAILDEKRIPVRRKEIGGRQTRALILEVGTGEAWVETGAERISL